jgi:hypothetical protein
MDWVSPLSSTNLSSGFFEPQIQARPKLQCFECTDAISGGDKVTHHVPIGSYMILNTLSTRVGIRRPVKGRAMKIMVSKDEADHNMPTPPPGADPNEFIVCGDMLIWLGEHADQGKDYPASLRRFTFEGRTNFGELRKLLYSLSHRPEIQAGKLPVTLIHPFREYDNGYGPLGAMVLEPVDYVDFDLELWGEAPLNRPPSAILTGSTPQPKLERSAPAESPDAVATVTTAEPVGKAEGPAQPKADPLASFRPATRKTPY